MRSAEGRRLPWALFALLLTSYAYFYQAGGWNENSRMDLVRALVDDHSLAIDAYQANTGDKAKIGEHYYSDKAPGLSIVAIPAYLVVRLFRARISEHGYAVVASYVVTVLTVGVATALLGVLIFWASRKLGVSRRGSVLAALGYGLGTTAFLFATQLFSHQLAALLIFSAFLLLWRCRERYTDLSSFSAGCLCAAAVVSEFPTAPVAVILFVYHATPERRWRRLGTFAAGVLVLLIPLAVYSTLAFGGPFRTGYGALADAGARGEMLSRGILGISYPHLGVMVELWIGRYRGLLPYSPVLVIALAGFVMALSRPSDESAERFPHKREVFAALAVVVYFVLFVSSYAWWQGGASFGSRHLLPMLPFLVLPLGRAADLRPKLTLALVIVSAAMMLIVVSVQPKPSERLDNPFFRNIAPAFFRGELARGNICPLSGTSGGRAHQPFLQGAFHDSFNLGMVLGARGKRTIVPLFALWIAYGVGLWRATRRDTEEI